MIPLSARARIDRVLWVLAIIGACAAVRLLPECQFLSMTGLPCPMCGGTRSAACLLQGDVTGAWNWNPWAIAWVALAAAVAAAWMLEAAMGRTLAYPAWWRRASSFAVCLLASLTAAMWVARLTGFAFPWPTGV